MNLLKPISCLAILLALAGCASNPSYDDLGGYYGDPAYPVGGPVYGYYPGYAAPAYAAPSVYLYSSRTYYRGDQHHHGHDHNRHHGGRDRDDHDGRYRRPSGQPSKIAPSSAKPSTAAPSARPPSARSPSGRPPGRSEHRRD